MADPLLAEVIDEVLPSRRLPPQQAGVAAYHAIRRAGEVACLVRDEGADAIGAYLDRISPEGVYGLVVALAAMVDVDKTPEELLGWLEGPSLLTRAEVRTTESAA